MSSPPIEPMSEHIPDQFPLGKAQRLGRRAYESPALPLSYSAVGSKLTEHDPSQQPRDMQPITVEQHMPCRGQAARIDRGRDQSVWRGWPRVASVTIKTLESLRSLGVRVVIDDFGTGYFSLSHRRQFPVDVLKIASEFVQVPVGDAKSAALAGAIVALSKSLRIVTVAEGIENAAQADRMRSLGCTYGQGLFFARPLTVEDVEVATRAPRPEPVAPGTPAASGQDSMPARRVRTQDATPGRSVFDVRPA